VDHRFLSAEQNQFFHNQKSFAEVLKANGNYHTGMYGKWHIGGRVPSGGKYSQDMERPLSCYDID
jgi:arylsulfatase A-like enzyme